MSREFRSKSLGKTRKWVLISLELNYPHIKPAVIYLMDEILQALETPLNQFKVNSNLLHIGNGNGNAAGHLQNCLQKELLVRLSMNLFGSLAD